MLENREQPGFEEQPPRPPKELKPDDLSFVCETCTDRPGGCAQCGWGEKQKRQEVNN